MYFLYETCHTNKVYSYFLWLLLSLLLLLLLLLRGIWGSVSCAGTSTHGQEEQPTCVYPLPLPPAPRPAPRPAPAPHLSPHLSPRPALCAAWLSGEEEPALSTLVVAPEELVLVLSCVFKVWGIISQKSVIVIKGLNQTFPDSVSAGLFFITVVLKILPLLCCSLKGSWRGQSSCSCSDADFHSAFSFWLINYKWCHLRTSAEALLWIPGHQVASLPVQKDFSASFLSSHTDVLQCGSFGHFGTQSVNQH